MNKPALILTLLLMFYVGYLILNFFYHIQYVRKLAHQCDPSVHGGGHG
jgi:hypothetical protein